MIFAVDAFFLHDGLVYRFEEQSAQKKAPESAFQFMSNPRRNAISTRAELSAATGRN